MSSIAKAVAVLVLACAACGGVGAGVGGGSGSTGTAAIADGNAACQAQCVANAHPEAPTFYSSADGGLLPNRYCAEITAVTAASLPCHGSDATPSAGYLVCCAYSTDPAYGTVANPGFALASRSIIPGGSADPCTRITNATCVLATAPTGLPPPHNWCVGLQEIAGSTLPDGTFSQLPDEVGKTCCCH